ncbi:hypothetical protein AWB75_02208 [Caballeronia catudaia]|uniref:Uncharacterized protein n=1 Tax=Caballeronia catudaia TaxID=1777136 RepID=A0A158AHG1_9BURK|nr:hypothetical protein [Caballeronia catudaia]SAK57341.1 hypothetical protein AWB75_02208 [Caballeronia catudaia]
MYQTMEGNARPHRTAECFAEGLQDATQAELLSRLQSVSDDIMRLAGKLHAGRDATDDDADAITGQHALAQQLIGRLLAMPASQA